MGIKNFKLKSMDCGSKIIDDCAIGTTDGTILASD